MKKELNNKIEDILLDFAPLFNELSISDLQGVAGVEARKIIKLISEDK